MLLLKLLSTQTDEQHPISTVDLLSYFDALDMKPDRKTLKADIDLLYEMGLNVVTVPGNPVQYFVADRGFELPEIKLLIDAVQSSRFITAKKSKALTNKLVTRLASTQQAKELARTLYTANRVKPVNEQIYVHVDHIFTAINGHTKITFQYIEYTPEKKRVVKHNGLFYSVSPYALLWNGDYYYCVGYSDSHSKVVTFRVDRMKVLKTNNIPAVTPDASFDVEDYYTGVFDMFDGEEMCIELLCENRHMKSVVDHFGEKVPTSIADPEHFIATVNVFVSPTFYAWIFQFCGEIKILSPQTATDQYREMCRK